MRSRRRLGAALQQALGGKLEFSRAAEERAPGAGILANAARGRVFQALLDRPLTHEAGLARACRLSPPSVRWHLKVLGEAGLVHAVRGSREVRFFVSGTGEDESRASLLALRARLALPVLSAVLQSPGLTLRELADEVRASPQAVLRAKARLEALGLLERHKDGKFTRMYPSEGLGRFLARRTSGLPGSFARVEAALTDAGESVSVTRRGREEIVFQVGRRGARREFRLRAQGPLLPDARA